MATTLQLGPGDHGRPMTYDEFMAGDYQQGYRYELIHGRLYVSPMPNVPHARILRYLLLQLESYSQQQPEVVNWISSGARVFVPDSEDATVPEPDIAGYRDFPVEREWEIHWREFSPILVVEVLGGEDEEKDLVRNVDLYFQVSSIQEYWVYDVRNPPEGLNLKVHRRLKERWQVLDFDADAVYTTPLLPGFELPVRPR